MNLLEILEENNDIILAEAVKINNGKEAWELIKSNKIGVKLDPSYKFNDDDTDKIDTIIMSMDKMIKDVGANNAPFAVQLAVNKVPLSVLENASKIIPNLVKYRNRPWAKQVPGYSDIMDLNSKEKLDARKWVSVAENLEAEEQNHGHSNKSEVEEAYKDGTWTLYIPKSWKGAKSVSFYGKKGENQTPTEWCTRANKKYYDMYSENSPLYIIRNWENGKSYQIAFDKLNVHFLDQNDTRGDEITKGDLSTIPYGLLKKIKWNGRTLADYKKESERTEMKKGEMKNTTSIDLSRLTWTFDKKAEWESPKDEGNGAVSQVMKNLNTFGGNNDLITFMIKGKSFKFKKRDGYIKKYYYKNKPDYLILSILSKANGVNPFICGYDVSANYWRDVSINEFVKLVGDNGYLVNKAGAEFDKADTKRSERAANKNVDAQNEKKFLSRMANRFATITENKYIQRGLIDKQNQVSVDITTRNKNLGDGAKNFGNFMPTEFEVYIYAPNGFGGRQCVVTIFFGVENRKCFIKKAEGYNAHAVDRFKSELENATNEAYKEYIKEAVHDEYGRRKRSEYREKSKGAVVYDIDKAKKLQLEDYFPY